MSDEPAILVENLSKSYRAGRAVTDVPIPMGFPGSRSSRRRGREDEAVDEEDELEERPDDDEERRRREEREAGADETDGSDESDESDRIVHALRDVSLQVRRGTRLGVLGAAGSGKSTLLKVVARITPPTEGRVTVRGRVSPPLDLAASFLNPNATGRQNAIQVARMFGLHKRSVEPRLDDIFELAGIPEKLHHRVGTYSNRQFRRLGISIALNLDPDILLVDERLAAGDREFDERVHEHLMKATAQGDLTILFAATEVETVSGICDEAIWMSDGRIVERRALEKKAEAEPPRRRTRRAGAPAQGGLDALDPEDRDLLEQLVGRRRSYEQVAVARGVGAERVRDDARRALAVAAPDGGRVEPEVRDQIADYMLGQSNPSPEELERMAATPAARVWPVVIAHYLEHLAPEGLPVFPRQPGPAGYESFVPPPDPGAAVLAEYLAIALGADRAREALAMATDKTIWVGASQVKWSDVSEAAGFDHEEAKAVTQRLLASRSAAGLPDPDTALRGDRVSIAAATLRSADGLPAYSVRLCEDVLVETVIDAAGSDLRLRVELVLETRDQEPRRIDQPEEFLVETAGRYHVMARFPAALLDGGDYRARVVAHVAADGHESRVELRDAFTFEALDTGEGAHDDDEPPRETLGPGDVEWRVNP